MSKIKTLSERGKSAQNSIQSNSRLNTLERQQNGKNPSVIPNLSREGQIERTKLAAVTYVNEPEKLLKRARRRSFNMPFNNALHKAAKASKYSLLEKAYRKSYHCCDELTYLSDGRVISKYCDKRWCMICAPIRTAKAINNFLWWVEENMEDLYMVTIHRPTVDAFSLKAEIKDRQNIIRAINQKLQEQSRNGKRPRLEGIRKLECTVRPNDMFHPHHHILIKGLENAKAYRNEWIKRNPTCEASKQHVVKCKPGTEKELFKYVTKIITDSKGRRVNASALDVIFNAMHRVRTWQSFGFKLPKEIEEGSINKKAWAISNAIWAEHEHDWFRTDNGEAVTGYHPGEKFKEFLKTGIYVEENYQWDRHYKNYIEQGCNKIAPDDKDLFEDLEKWGDEIPVTSE